jgi:hypothetical protein
LTAPLFFFTSGKIMHVIYSTQSSDYIPGQRYSHPGYFSAIRDGVTKVTVIGEWPDVVAAYEAAGVPVEVQSPIVDEAPPAEAPLPRFASVQSKSTPKED